MGRPRIPNGSWGNINTTKLSDGRTEAYVQYRRLDGVLRKARLVAPTRAAAERELKVRLRSLVVDSPAERAGTSFGEIAELYLAEARMLNSLSPASQHENERLLRAQLLPRLGKRRIDEISPLLVAEIYRQMVDHAAPQARNAKGVLNKVMDYALRMELIDRNPVAAIRSVKRREPEIFAPDRDELVLLRDAIEGYGNRPGRMGPLPSSLLQDVVEIILGTSARIGEVLGIRWDEDVDLASAVPTIEFNGSVKEGSGQPKRWEPSLKTEAGKRRVPINDVVAGILMRRMIENTRGDRFVFSTRSGAPNGPQDVHRALRNVRGHAGLPPQWVPRALRQTVATAVANEMGIEAAAGTLGHKRSRVTEKHYAKRPPQTPDVRAVTARLHSLPPDAVD